MMTDERFSQICEELRLMDGISKRAASELLVEVKARRYESDMAHGDHMRMITEALQNDDQDLARHILDETLNPTAYSDPSLGKSK